jgi:hypothetical protein
MPSKKQGPAKKTGQPKKTEKTSASKPTKKPVKPKGIAAAEKTVELSVQVPQQIEDFLKATSVPKGFVTTKKIAVSDLRRRLNDLNIRPTVSVEELRETINRIKPPRVPEDKLPEDIRASIRALKPQTRRFHGAKIELSWFPIPPFFSPCADKFGYMSSAAVRAATKLPFNVATQALLGQLGNMMGDPGRDPNPSSQNSSDAGVSTIPAGFTYFGQFVDHDITLDVSSTLDAATDANTINNMRNPSLDLDSLYGRGPGLDPFLYEFPSSGNPTAIKFKTGSNLASGPGGPSSTNNAGGMIAQTNWDVPRIAGTQTAVIGDPRNDENLIVVQFHHAMLRFHNAVVDLLLAASFGADIFSEAKRIVTHHYQWAVVHDFLERVCGATAVSNAEASVVALPGSAFRMPVEFAVAAYRFGHSMIRDRYWLNFNFTNQPLFDVFAFNRPPNLPVRSNWVVDFNAFFDTGFIVPVNNKARKIDSFMAAGLEALPGLAGMMAILATRNLRRGLALGLPSGQGMANAFGVPPLTPAQLTSGLQADEIAVLNASGGLLMNKTPLWYYILREAAVLNGGNQLGPVGGRIVAETFIRILKRDASSYLNAGPFAPMLPSAVPGTFTVADLVNFAGITQPS